MNLLALDTSSVACSVALQFGGEIFSRHEEQPREHTRLLLPMINSILDEAGTSVAGLDAIVLGNGPGSFIGMRIAASVAQGLAFASGLQIVPVSSMAAVGSRVLAGGEFDEVVVAQDAHMQQVYLGIYTADSDGLATETVPERLHDLATIEELDPDRVAGRVAAGFGWQRYPELSVANRDRLTVVSDIFHPHAEDLLTLGRAAMAEGKAVAPQEIVPAYLRQKVAEKPGRGS
jgi:tRNA threonylcarbamoyladenosine biosynthesis protein TsaB